MYGITWDTEMTQIEPIEPKISITSTLLHDMLLKELEGTSVADLLGQFGISTHIVESGAIVVNQALDYRKTVTVENPAILYADGKWTLYCTNLWLQIMHRSKPVLAVALIPLLEAYIHTQRTEDIMSNNMFKNMMDKFGITPDAIKNAKATFN